MRKFDYNQRVLVRIVDVGAGHVALTDPRAGTVRRKCLKDDGAWVELDERDILGKMIHPFPEGDPRGKQVLTHPAWCDPESKSVARRRWRRK